MSRTHHARKPRVRRVCACGRREERCAEMLRERANRALHQSDMMRAFMTAPRLAGQDYATVKRMSAMAPFTLDVQHTTAPNGIGSITFGLA